MATKSLLNALGKALYYSGASAHWLSAGTLKAGSTLYGTSGADTLYGNGSVDVTMSGGAGDDIYYVYSGHDHVTEAVGGGVDTVNAQISYILGANIENLTETGNKAYAFGNSLDNIISGNSNSQTINGAAGNDILIGGGGVDTFIVSKGNGSDLITDFGTDDIIRLDQYGFTSFDQVQAKLSQQGANVKLDLGNGESLIFANKTVASLQASQFQLTLDRSQLTQTFSDDFNTLSLHNATTGTGTWDTKYSWAGASGCTLASNNELEWYINPDYAPTASVNPFSVSNGVLDIHAQKTPDSIKSLINNSQYTSGMLTTHSTFSQTYGYFEMRADMPSNQGAWPAFWLLPEDGSWPPELDVVEMTGQDTHTVLTTAHSDATGTHTTQSTAVKELSTEGYHNYGVLWTQNTITWYFDDVAVSQAATPADMHGPMYMLVNLAVGGMAGAPADGLPNGSDMKIDYIKAYSLADAPVAAASVAAPAHSTGVI